MRVRSAIFSEMSGTLNGTVASRAKGGTIIRTRSTPTNPRTARQLLVRTAFTACTQATAAWDADAYLRWAAYAKPLMGRTDLGETFTPTPQQAFAQINMLRAQLGLALIATPPTPVSALAPGNVVFGANAGDPITFHYGGASDPSEDCLTAGGGLVVYTAIRPVTHRFRRGGWDAVQVYRGANPRVDEALPLSVGITRAARQMKYFIHISGSTPNGTRMPDFDLVQIV
jgi:hypothetical protein